MVPNTTKSTAAPAGPAVLTVGIDGVKVPASVNRIRPVVPAGIEPRGTAVLELLISTDGTVGGVTQLAKVQQPPEPALDQAAIDAARQFTFAPTIINGVAHPVRLRYAFNFSRMNER